MSPDHEGLQVQPTTDKMVDDPGKIAAGQPAGHAPAYGSKEAAEVNHREVANGQRILGLKRRSFIGLAVLLFIVVAAAVGGGVGGALGSRRSDSSPAMSSSASSSSVSSLASSINTIMSTSLGQTLSSQTPSTTAAGTSTASTTSSATSSSASAIPSLGRYNCPSDNGTTYRPSQAPTLAFQRLCDADFSGLGVNGQTNMMDLRYIIATSVEQCVDACVSDRLAGLNCSAVSYGANITFALARTDGINGNCFLKDQRSAAILYRTPDVKAESAFLLT